jgi:hypothetical protein
MTMGNFYDEFQRLKTENAGITLLNAENIVLRRVLSNIRASIQEVNVETSAVSCVAPSTFTSSSKTKGLTERRAESQQIKDAILQILQSSDYNLSSEDLRSKFEDKAGKLPKSPIAYLREGIDQGIVRMEGRGRWTTYRYVGKETAVEI